MLGASIDKCLRLRGLRCICAVPCADSLSFVRSFVLRSVEPGHPVAFVRVCVTRPHFTTTTTTTYSPTRLPTSPSHPTDPGPFAHPSIQSPTVFFSLCSLPCAWLVSALVSPVLAAWLVVSGVMFAPVASLGRVVSSTGFDWATGSLGVWCCSTSPVCPLILRSKPEQVKGWAGGICNWGTSFSVFPVFPCLFPCFWSMSAIYWCIGEQRRTP